MSENVWTNCQEVLADNGPTHQVSIAHTDGKNFEMTISGTAVDDPDVIEFTVTGDEATLKLFQDYFDGTPVALSDFIKMFKVDHRTFRWNKIFAQSLT